MEHCSLLSISLVKSVWLLNKFGISQQKKINKFGSEFVTKHGITLFDCN